MNTYQDNVGEMQQGAVTLLDILGWKGVWQRKADAVQSLLNLIEIAKERSGKIVGTEKRYNELKVDVKSISDTIAIVTYGECDLSLEFHAGMSGIIIRESLLQEIPVRGATCYGSLSTNGNIMVGPAIDEVAAWYEMADWIGVIQTPTAYLRGSHQYKYEYLLAEYSVPIKQYGKYKTYCVNWLYQWSGENLNRHDFKDILLKMGPITPSIANKFFNTLDFYDHVY